MDTDTNGIPPQAWVGVEEPTASGIDPIENRIEAITKPYGGFWTSTLKENEHGEATCAWLEWMHGVDWGFEDGMGLWRLDVQPDTDVYVIHDPDDLNQLVTAAPLADEDSPLPSLHTELYADLDFEFMAKSGSGYDALHLTEHGQAVTKWSRPALTGWDCESTLWFSWQFETVEYLRDVHPPDN